MELLSDDVLDDMWHNPPTTIFNEFIPTNVILRQIVQAQARITKQEILQRLCNLGVKPLYDTYGIPSQIAYYRIDIPADIWRELHQD
jgi:hypothetical protein